MHNFFEAKGRKLELGGVRFWGRGSELPPHQMLGGLWSGVSSPMATNAFWCILSWKIASGSNFFDYLFQLKNWKWCTLCWNAAVGVPNDRKLPKIPDFGMNWTSPVHSKVRYFRPSASMVTTVRPRTTIH